MKWINISYKLPEFEQKVLIAMPREKKNEFYITSGFLEEINKKGNKWVYYNKYGYNINYYVTHWMPLPDPPEECDE